MNKTIQTTSTNMNAAGPVLSWRDRQHDQTLSTDEALVFATGLARCSESEALELTEIMFAVDDASGQLVLQRGRDPRQVGRGQAVRYRMTHWSLLQACNLIRAPIDYIRRLPTDLALDCLNFSLRERGKQVSIYRTISDFVGFGTSVPAGTIRAFTSKKYARITDASILQWVLSTGKSQSVCYISDRGCFSAVRGDYVRGVQGLPVRLALMVENSEVGASSVKAQACIEQSGARIPITMSRASVRHVGNDVDVKAVAALDDAYGEFRRIDTTSLSRRLAETSALETRDRGEWYAMLKSCGITKALADRILPAGEMPRISRWEMAWYLARRASTIPYYDTRCEAEKKAARVLGV